MNIYLAEGGYNVVDKEVMVLTVLHPFDTVEVLGVFDDKQELARVCHYIIEKETSLMNDINHLHIYKCPLNKIIAEFYPEDYDDPESVGSFLENRPDICDEILGEEFLNSIREKQKRKLKAYLEAQQEELDL